MANVLEVSIVDFVLSKIEALQVLTDQFGGSSKQVGPFKVTLDTLLRVIGAVDWERVHSGWRDTYLYLYEHFLAEYDPVKRRHRRLDAPG